ncbi:expressed unknown protein [Seminavis robusta]|uniref:Uncharacterized protein n=1 Tax=Seminavis robusta TaxID=568900 RepID=A0A9N8E0J1_9STRA|nr:expressed unknown protein [Seminavis robusta]|eukprot:Sro429_g140980.1 n/a (298) ;mRNA; r:7311-8204
MMFRSAALFLLVSHDIGSLLSQAWQRPLLTSLRRAHGQDFFLCRSKAPFSRALLCSASAVNHNEVELIDDVSSLLKGRSSREVWRPNKQDVERISWGKPAKKKGTGSRGVPHRINRDERFLFDQARTKGFLEVAGSAWRSQRRDAPLLNTYRSWCDACAKPSIVLHKSSTGVDDAVVVDISTLRLELASEFQAVADACMQQQSGGSIRNQGGVHEVNDEELKDTETQSSDAWETRPIYQLPPYCIVWDSLQRSDAKVLAKTLAMFCRTADKGREKKSKKPVGVKPGKGRRHGGYGIG